MTTIDDVLRARRLLDGVVHRTPLLHATALDDMAGTRLLLKAENLQRVGAFKIRGAYTAIASLSDAERRRGVVAHSSGNHAQGTALAARLLGVRATIVMPRTSPSVKVDATRAYGAEVVFCDDSSDDRERVARDIVERDGATLVPPFDDDRIIAGQGTTALEVLDDDPDIDCLVVPVGGGGLISGCAVAVKARNPRVRIVGVETEAANDAQQSFRTGRIVKIAPPRTIADGMRTQALAPRTFEVIRNLVDDMVTVSDDDVRRTMKLLALRLKTVAEPTGAVAPAAVLARTVGATRRVCAIISGGNVEPSLLAEVLTA